MFLNTAVWIKVMLAILVAFVVSIALTPFVKRLAVKVGAVDVPGEARRVHDHPIPRMGGLAIFLGFIVSTLLFADITQEVRGILIGSIIIVITGVIDDIVSLRAWTKFLIQILAAVIAVLHGVVINVVSNPNVFSNQEAIVLGWVAIPLTVLWIVGITNSVNLIDGLDGLAVGVSTISCVTILVVALLVSEPNVALIVGSARRRMHRLHALQPQPRPHLHGRHRFAAARLCAGNGVGARPVQVLCNRDIRRAGARTGRCRCRTRSLRSAAASCTVRARFTPTAATSTTSSWISA